MPSSTSPEARGRAGEPRPWEFTETLMQPKLRQRRGHGSDVDLWIEAGLDVF